MRGAPFVQTERHERMQVAFRLDIREAVAGGPIPGNGAVGRTCGLPLQLAGQSVDPHHRGARGRPDLHGGVEEAGAHETESLQGGADQDLVGHRCPPLALHDHVRMGAGAPGAEVEASPEGHPPVAQQGIEATGMDGIAGGRGEAHHVGRSGGKAALDGAGQTRQVELRRGESPPGEVDPRVAAQRRRRALGPDDGGPDVLPSCLPHREPALRGDDRAVLGLERRIRELDAAGEVDLRPSQGLGRAREAQELGGPDDAR